MLISSEVVVQKSVFHRIKKYVQVENSKIEASYCLQLQFMYQETPKGKRIQM